VRKGSLRHAKARDMLMVPRAKRLRYEIRLARQSGIELRNCLLADLEQSFGVGDRLGRSMLDNHCNGSGRQAHGGGKGDPGQGALSSLAARIWATL
jgi:hypothetical protein